MKLIRDVPCYERHIVYATLYQSFLRFWIQWQIPDVGPASKRRRAKDSRQSEVRASMGRAGGG